jgi:hypothetical protein
MSDVAMFFNVAPRSEISAETWSMVLAPGMTKCSGNHANVSEMRSLRVAMVHVRQQR